MTDDSLIRLEALIALSPDDDGGNGGADMVAPIRSAFCDADVFVLGRQDQGRPEQPDILCYIDQTDQIDVLPVFTRLDIAKNAKLLNRDEGWEQYDVLRVSGRDIWTILPKTRTVVINPWSRLQYRLVPAER